VIPAISADAADQMNKSMSVVIMEYNTTITPIKKIAFKILIEFMILDCYGR
jgi:hypothetical protein